MKITTSILENLVKEINIITNSPLEYSDANTKHSNINHYFLQGAYGGYQLQRIMNEGGGIHSITTGFISKQQIYKQLHVYLKAIKSKIEA